ncbi:hypothetical protein ZIOFF_032708 [Zingiber officinale]|uniref:Negatively light-regulated protein n=1 Tax=Zingiber officinale TaxID=94328 RepID=A0A8J5LBR8_ZINOF|nr:hypothetical protein ZIOFF_032708 [Zingiber officinale]
MDTDEDLNQTEANEMPSSQQEEEVLKKKYGGIDHERAYFDSADWALGKGAEKPKGPLEALRPKLQPTQQQARSRRSAYASSDNKDGGNATAEEITEDTNSSDHKSIDFLDQ